MEDEHYIPPDPDVQALWDQRRAAVERRAEQLRQEQECKALEQQLAQDPRPFWNGSMNSAVIVESEPAIVISPVRIT